MTWSRAWSWQDVRKSRAAAQAWKPSKAAEKRYAKQLRSVAGHVADLLAKSSDPVAVQEQLDAYADSLDPWAEQAAANMVRSVKRKNEQTWRAAAERWGIDLQGLLDVDIEHAVQAKIQENIQLIKSIPADAAANVGILAQKAVLAGGRADQLADKIAAQGQTTMSRAATIARTEISKAGTALTQARAQGVGSDGYIWRTTRAGNRRASHAAMEGRFVKWSQPPTLDGMTGHAGEFPNCNCYPEPVVHDSAGREVASPIPTAQEEKASGEHKLRSQWERQPVSSVTPHLSGTPLHNVERSKFPIEKLESYSLNPKHPVGQHKARVWEAALGVGQHHAGEIRQQIMDQLRKVPAQRGRVDEYGERFETYVPVTGPDGRTVDVLASWIYKKSEDGRSVSTVPTLTTCFIPKRS